MSRAPSCFRSYPSATPPLWKRDARGGCETQRSNRQAIDGRPLTDLRTPPPGLHLNRREFIATALAIVLLPGSSQIDAAAQQSPIDIIFYHTAAATLGRVYLSEHPDEADSEHLRALLNARLRIDSNDVRTRCAQVQRQLHAEYIDGDLAEVDGWLLSRTEARLYALVALSIA